MDPGEALYQSKENIQPLTHGRITSQFGTALHAQSNADVQQELNKKVEYFELQLLSYEGDDELAVWVEYLSWIEQSFPKGGKEGNLRVVLEKCLTKFKDATWYMQDQRLIKLWIKYIDLVTDKSPAEMYSMAHAHGIGTETSLFYQFWAYEYEKCKNFRKADEVYLLGIHNRAQPEEALLQAHRIFQTAVARLTLYGTLPSPKRPEISERQVMSNLQPHGSKNQVRNGRTGSSALHSNLAPLTNTNVVSTHANNGKRGTLKIFTDNKEENSLVTPHQYLHSLPRPKVTDKENHLEAGPWTGSGVSRKQRPLPIPESKPAKFQVHTDEPADPDPNGRVSNPARCFPNALQSIKLDGYEMHPLFEEVDPTKKPMYAKHKVYNGGREFSFEELRALKYFKTEREKKDCLRLQSHQTRDDQGDCESKLEVPEQTWIDNELCNKDVISVDPLTQAQSFLSPKTVHSEVCEVKATTSLQNEHVDQCEEVPVFLGSSENSLVMLDSKSNVTVSGGKPAVDSNGMRSLMNIQEQLVHLSIIQRDGVMDKEIRCTSKVPNCVQFGGATLELPSQPNILTDNKNSACLKREWCSPIANDGKKGYIHETDKGCVLASPVHILKLPKMDGRPEGMSVSHFETKLVNTSRDLISSKGIVHSNVAYIEEVALQGRNDSSSSNDPTPLHSQSMTANTKEAMAFMMNEMWGSNVGPRSVGKATSPSVGATEQAPLQVEVPFQIFTDDDDDARIILPLPPHHVLPTTDPGSELTQLKNPQKVEIPFQIFSDDDDGDKALPLPTVRVSPATDQRSEHTKQKNPQKRSRPIFYLGDEALEANNKENVLIPVQNLQIYEDEENLPVEIPAVASPGMTESELRALEGTDAKENNPPLNYVLEKIDHRPMEGVLQPSRNIPYQDNEEPEYDNMTCSTQAFNFPLMSSTPFHSNIVQHIPYADQSISIPDNSNKDNFRFASASEEPEQMKLVSQAEAVSKGNLSVIMENSKEFKSCSSSGSSNGGTTTRRSMFYNNSQWSSTRENVSELHHRLAISDIHKESTVNSASVKKHMSEYIRTNDHKGGLQTKHFQCYETKEELTETMDSKQKCITGNVKSSVDVDHEVVQLQGEHQERFVVNSQLKELFTADIFSSPITKSDEMYSSVPFFDMKEFSSKKVTSYPEECFEIKHEGHTPTPHFSTTTNLPENIRPDVDNRGAGIKLNFKEEFKQEAIHQLESRDSVPDKQLTDHFDPFDATLIGKLLKDVGFPYNQYIKNYFEVEKELPTLKRGSVLYLGDAVLNIESHLGEGAYAKVFKVINCHGIPKALKVQKPSWVWEMYITNEIHSRLESIQQSKAVMYVEECYLFKNGSALLYEYSKYGTLLTAINKMKGEWKPKEIEVLSMFWAIEILRIVEQIHSCQIIHGDLKPDNFLIRSLPSSEMTEPSLQLIDFGRSIDMSLFAPGTSFNVPVQTESFQCTEMQTGRPWTYQTDLYGVAASVHCILFGDYMKVSFTNGHWFINTNFPRYFNKPLWESFFLQLLNIESCSKMPDLRSMRRKFENELEGSQKDIKRSYSYFCNLMGKH